MTKFFFQTVYVMPSSSARCSQLPRAVDKVPFYASLKKLRDYLRGDLKELDDSEVCFPDLELVDGKGYQLLFKGQQVPILYSIKAQKLAK